MKTNCYKDVDLSYIPYRAKSGSKLDALVAKYGSSTLCCTFKKKIEEADELLLSYSSECCRMAPFFYGIAKCAKKIAQGDNNLKGITVAIPKEEFCLSNLMGIKNRMVDLLAYFKRRATGAMIAIITMGGLFTLSIGLFVFIALTQRKLCLTASYVFSFIGFSFFVMVLSVAWVGIIMATFVRRLRYALDEKWLQSFIDMSNRVQYADQKDKRYFYNILEGTFAEVDRAYRITGAICKTNACQNIIDAKIPPKKDLYQPL